MKLFSPERSVDRTVATTIQRRWRWAALAGLILFLILSGYALAVTGANNASKGRPVAVLVAATDIRAGTKITDGMVRVTAISPQDPGLLVTLVEASNRSTIIGQVASVTVPAGHLIPAEVASPQIHSQLWITAVPIKRLPSDLAAGDHVALVAEALNKAGQPVAFVFMQDVEVVHVAGSQVDLFLPARVVPQVEWYGDHGGLVLVKMQPGVIQQDLPAGTGS